MIKRINTLSHSIWGLALGYFIFYTPYSAMTKALSRGLLPGMAGEVSGFQMLPAAAIGTMLMFYLMLPVMGWSNHAGKIRVARWRIPFATSKWTLLSGASTAMIICTTTLAYSFKGISIVFAALLMRGGVMLMSPIVDVLYKRKVHWTSFTALVLSIGALLYMFWDKGSYEMTLVAGLNIAAYLSGYVFRLQFMTHAAKSEHQVLNKKFFIEEMLAAGVILVGMTILGALIGNWPVLQDVRLGFTELLFTPLAVPTLIIGILYAALYTNGSRIYLHHRENTFCIPINRASSLMAGVFGSLLLGLFFNESFFNTTQLISAGVILIALIVLAIPSLQARKKGDVHGLTLVKRLYLYICQSNTSRSPMAQAICTAEVAARLGVDLNQIDDTNLKIMSAGLSDQDGKPMAEEAYDVLNGLDVPVENYKSTALTEALAKEAEAIFVMTKEQQKQVSERYPYLEEKILLLDTQDIPNPAGMPVETYKEVAERIQQRVRRHIDEGAIVV